MFHLLLKTPSEFPSLRACSLPSPILLLRPEMGTFSSALWSSFSLKLSISHQVSLIQLPQYLSDLLTSLLPFVHSLIHAPGIPHQDHSSHFLTGPLPQVWPLQVNRLIVHTTATVIFPKYSSALLLCLKPLVAPHTGLGINFELANMTLKAIQDLSSTVPPVSLLPTPFPSHKMCLVPSCISITNLSVLHVQDLPWSRCAVYRCGIKSDHVTFSVKPLPAQPGR